MMTRTQIAIALGASAVIVAIVFGLSPHKTSLASKASSNKDGMDILGITKNVDTLPDQQYPTH